MIVEAQTFEMAGAYLLASDVSSRRAAAELPQRLAGESSERCSHIDVPALVDLEVLQHAAAGSVHSR